MTSMLKYIYTILLAAVLLFLGYFVWRQYIMAPIESQSATLIKQEKKIKKAIKKMKSSGNANLAGAMFYKSEMRSANAVSESLYHLLKEHSDVTLLGMKQSVLETKPITEVIGKPVKGVASKVSVIKFSIKLLGEYKNIYRLLADIQKNEKGLFWRRFDMKTNSYPKVACTVKFYITEPL